MVGPGDNGNSVQRFGATTFGLVLDWVCLAVFLLLAMVNVIRGNVSGAVIFVALAALAVALLVIHLRRRRSAAASSSTTLGP
jgi:hypothetical protein